MSKIQWASEKEKYEAIGYLSKPGVVGCIEATVPADLLDKFKKEFDGKYTSEFPYITKAGSKFGYQFRIYLNDVEGCPEFLEKQLDEKYGNRINDTGFISELVKDYGFIFSHKQNSTGMIWDQINHKINHSKSKNENREAFKKGFQVYNTFLREIDEIIKKGKVPVPVFKEEPIHRKRTSLQRTAKNEMKTTLSSKQLRKLGWLGEEYIYKMLISKNREFLNRLCLEDGFSVDWFNDGFRNDVNWEDKSVGKGCDIVIHTGNTDIFLEVKSSKRKTGLFTMTSNEMRLMKRKKNYFFIIKLDYLERLLKDESPEIMIINSPYDKYFRPEKMKEATFIMGE